MKFERRQDEVAMILGISNYHGVCTRNPWNQGKQDHGPQSLLSLIKENRRISTCNRLDLQHQDLNRLCPKISLITGRWSSELEVTQEVLVFPVACHSCGDTIHNLMTWLILSYCLSQHAPPVQCTYRLFGICLRQKYLKR